MNTKIIPSIITIAKVFFYAARRFDRERGFEAAAALAFYTIVSLFPLFLLLIVGSSLLIEEQAVKERMLTMVFEFVPKVSRHLIKNNLEQVLQARKEFSVVATLALVWTASSVFSGLVQNINRAWKHPHSLGVIKNRLLAVATAFILLTFLMFLYAIQHAINVIENWNWNLIPWVTVLVPSSRIITFAFIFLSLASLYKLVPTCKVRWRDAAVGALVSIASANLATEIYGYYLSVQLEQYNLVYGSLATVLGFMLWTYAMHVVILFGAHFSAQMKSKVK